MCTAISYLAGNHYFGRNLDLEFSYQEEVTVTPRNFPLPFRMEKDLKNHLAIIGVATIADGYPLYYDATNEAGLSMAGLNFPGNAVYQPPRPDADNISPFELIPWILGQCKTVRESRERIDKMNLADIPFSDAYPLSPLHWIISDADASITVEAIADGIRIYDNPIGVLTNNPPFDYHMHNLKNYLNLTREEPVNRFAPSQALAPYSRGLGAFGLPGDLSSQSRFVRAAFTKLNSVPSGDEITNLTQFFHILHAVEQQEGCVRVEKDFEKTVYTSCCNTEKGIYYYTTYENNQITGVSMHHTDLNADRLYRYPIIRHQQILMKN